MHGVQNFPTSPKNERINKIDDKKNLIAMSVMQIIQQVKIFQVHLLI